MNYQTLIKIVSIVIGIPLTILFFWILFTIVILTDPGNAYNG